MFPYEAYVSGRAVQAFLIDNADLCAYLAFGYLGMVRYGPGLALRLLGPPPPPIRDANGRLRSAPDPLWVRVFMIFWNGLLSAFSLSAAAVMVPAVLQRLFSENNNKNGENNNKSGWSSVVCRHDESLIYAGPCGAWMALFVLSKVPELVDTLVLILQKRRPPGLLQWYHHVSVLLFAWMSYALGSATMPVFGAMNVFVHAIMYPYFLLCSCGGKRLVAPFAPFITALQILQMVGGTALTVYSFAVNYDSYFRRGIAEVERLPCQVPRQLSLFGSLMYASYLYLFSKMFVEKYLTKKKKPEAAAAAAAAKKSV